VDLGDEIGKVLIDGLAPERPAGQPIELTLRLDATGELHVTAHEANGDKLRARFEPASGLDDHKKEATAEMLAKVHSDG